MMVRPRPSFRSIVLFSMWIAPTVLYVVVAGIAVYETGWLGPLAIALPVLWLLAWLVARFWTSGNGKRYTQLPKFESPDFWTDRDTQAIEVVEKFRERILVDRHGIVDLDRYLADARELASCLSRHYHEQTDDQAFHPITLLELLTVMHLASDDIEQWVAKNIPGSDLITLGHFAKLSDYAKYIDNSQKLVYLATAFLKPMKLVFYPLWRKSNATTEELQNDVSHLLYQQYLRTVGFYLIEMFSGRLAGGSAVYRERFGRWSNAMHQTGGRKDLLDANGPAEIVIAVMGQVKAGKSSLINALLQNQTAVTNILPETRQVARYSYTTPSGIRVTLLDTPGYNEADVSARQRHEVELASEAADVIWMVIDANVPAKDADVRMVKDIQHYYRERKHLKPPKIIGVLTHIDQLRPVQEWNPPYHWRNPQRAKEHSMAAAVEYARELFGDSVVEYACVYTGDQHRDDAAVVDELIPLVMSQLAEGQAAAMLKAFYDQLSKDRLQKLKSQFAGLLRSLGSIAFEGKRKVD